MSGISVVFNPPGPVALAFYECDAPISAIMGPIGSGKTTASLLKILVRATLQKKSLIDGVRYTKFRVIRDTYANLEATTIPSWHEWVPQKLGKWSGPKGRPKSHHLRFNAAHGTSKPQDVVDVQIEFLAIGEKSLEEAMKGWEGTGVLFEEGDGIPFEGLIFAFGRCARYPSMRHGGPSWNGLWMSFNAPDEDNWTYEHFIENLPESWRFFRQPSGFSPHAENLQNLPPNYYQDKAKDMPTHYVNRMIKNMFGQSRDGMVVFGDYEDDVHCSHTDLVPDPSLPLILGGDQGRGGAIVIAQQMLSGQWRVYDEIIAENVGAERFAGVLVRHLKDHYAGFNVSVGWGDPAGEGASDHDETTYWKIMKTHTGINWRMSPVPRNLWGPRKAAVEHVLVRMVAGQPALVISKKCKRLRRGFNSKYIYKRVATSNSIAKFHDRPEKGNGFDGVQDALQYLLCGGGEHTAVMRNIDHTKSIRPTSFGKARTSFNPLGRR